MDHIYWENLMRELEDPGKQWWLLSTGIEVAQFESCWMLRRVCAILRYLGTHWNGTVIEEDIYYDDDGRWIHEFAFDFEDEEDWLHASENIKSFLSENDLSGYVLRHDSAELDGEIGSPFNEEWDYQSRAHYRGEPEL